MKRLIKVLLILTVLSGMFFAMGAAKYKPQPQPQPKIDHAFPTMPSCITIIEDTWDVVYGEPCPKLRFAVDGVEMQEGVDFEYRYRPGTVGSYKTDYREWKEAGRFFDLAVYVKNEWANNRINEYLTSENTVYDHVIAYFYVYELDLSKCQYELPEKQYDSYPDSRLNTGKLTYNGYTIDRWDYYIAQERPIDQYNPLNYSITIQPRYKCLTGELNITYTYTPHPITSDNSYLKTELPSETIYTGAEIKPYNIKLYVDNKLLDRSYFDVVSYENNINAGKAKVTLKGKRGYEGTCEYEFDIHPCDIASDSVRISDPNKYGYTGKSVKPSPNLYSKAQVRLIEGKDYVISVSPSAIEKGEYTYTITGMGNFTGTRTESFTIDKIDISICDIPVIKIKSNNPEPIDELLWPKVTYNGSRVTYYRNTENFTKEPGVHKYTITGRGDYSGTAEVTYIVMEDITDYNIICGDKVYTGKPITPKLALQQADGKPTIYVDPAEFYTTFYNNTDVGTAKVTVVAARNLYYGNTIAYFNIVPASIKDCNVTYKKRLGYDGINPVKPELTITYNDMTLVEGKDYKVSYSNNTVTGKDTGKITITGIGNFKDTDVYTFDIYYNPNPTPTTSPAAGVTVEPSTGTSTATSPAPANNATTATTATTSAATAPQTTGAPAASTPSSNTQVAVSEETKSATSEFVARIYTYVLGREPEADGLAFWSDELISFRRTGAEVAQGFIFSEEFENRHTTDSEFVTILYKTFFGRDADEEGLSYWLTQLSTGLMDRVTVANGFIYSQEWADTCASYGIRSGGDLKPSGKIEPTDLTYAFVERMYTTALGRSYDEEGKQYWASELANFNVTGEYIGLAFFLSDEMNGYNLSSTEFTNRLYKTFMDREADADGIAYWVSVLNGGTPRQDVIMGFTHSEEFIGKCIDARIKPF